MAMKGKGEGATRSKMTWRKTKKGVRGKMGTKIQNYVI